MDPRIRRARVVLGIVLVVVVARLLFGDDPWSDGIAERLLEGKRVRPKDYQVTYGYWAWLALGVGAAGLLASVRRWLPGSAVRRPELGSAAPSRSFLVLVAGAVLVQAFFALPRLGHSLWQDEDHTARSYVSGGYLPEEDGDADGALRFWDTDWDDALLYDWGPNNPIGYSVVAKLTTGAWRWVSRPRDQRAHDVALRLPAFVFGLLSVAALAWLGLRLGFPAAGALAALVLALHPWHLRFAAEARGYSLVLMLGSAHVWLLLRALEVGTWGRWAAYGAVQVVLLWTYLAGVHVVLLLNLAAAVAIWRAHAHGPDSRVVWTRFLGANLVGALVWAVLMAGNVAILAEYLQDKGARSLGWTWIRELLALLGVGTPYDHGRAGADPIYPETVDLTAAWPVLFWGAAAASVALVALGAFRLARRHPVGGLLLLPFLGAGPLAWAVAASRGDFLYARNMIFALPPLVLLAAIGATALLSGPRRARLVLGAGAFGAVVAAFVVLTQPARSALSGRSLVPYRESVEATRGTIDPFAPGREKIWTASFSAEPYYYDPWVHMIDEPEQLRGLMERSEAEGASLFVNLGRLGLARRRHPEMMAVVESERFEEVAVLPAFEPDFTRHVYRYRGSGG